MKTTYIQIPANRARDLHVGDSTYSATHGLCKVLRFIDPDKSSAVVEILPTLKLTLPAKP